MKRRDWITDIGIVIVGASAAILTFTTLRSLAESCGITGWLSWLVPITIDVAGIVAARVWLRGDGPAEAVEFARGMSWACIAVSIAGNTGEHGMAAYGLTPPWWVVVAVSAVPVATLGAVVHLGHLRSRTGGPDPDSLSGTAGEDLDEVTVEMAAEEWRDPWSRFTGPDSDTSVALEATQVPDQRRKGTDPLLPKVIEWARDKGATALSQRAVRQEFKVGGQRSADLVRAAREAVQ